MSYEEYFNSVAKKLTGLLGGQVKNKAEVVAYMKTEEDVVKNQYELDLENYKAGKFADAVWSGCANSVAYCLYMMY